MCYIYYIYTTIMHKLIIHVTIILLLSTSISFAYIDPASGSILISAIIGGFLYIIFYLKVFYITLKKKIFALTNFFKKK